LLFRRSIHASDHDLSAYLDGRLAEEASARLDGHLAGCEICQRALAGLRAVRSALQGLPAVRAPRSFALREAAARPRARSFGQVAAMPLLRSVTAAATLAFFGLVGLDIAGGGSPASPSGGARLLGESGSLAGPESLSPPKAAQSATTATSANAQALPNAADTASTPHDTNATVLAEQAGTAAFRVAPSAVTPTPEREAASAEDSGSDMGIRIAEAALASVALASGAGLIIVSRRRNA
jgi:anti-sigma factor RsiW